MAQYNENLLDIYADLEVDSHINQNPKKYDKNGDEIIWEMRLPDISSNLSFVILSWFFRIATLVLICYFFALGVDKYIYYQRMEWYKEIMVLCLAMIFPFTDNSSSRNS